MQRVRKYIVLVTGLIVFLPGCALAQNNALQVEEQDMTYLDDI